MQLHEIKRLLNIKINYNKLNQKLNNERKSLQWPEQVIFKRKVTCD